MAKKGNNESSIYKDSKGRWCGAVTLPSAGKVKKKYFYGKTKKRSLIRSTSCFGSSRPRLTLSLARPLCTTGSALGLIHITAIFA